MYSFMALLLGKKVSTVTGMLEINHGGIMVADLRLFLKRQFLNASLSQPTDSQRQIPDSPDFLLIF